MDGGGCKRCCSPRALASFAASSIALRERLSMPAADGDATYRRRTGVAGRR